jgi:hypothetical protein
MMTMDWILEAFRLILIGIGIIILSSVYILLVVGLYRILLVKNTRNHKINLSNQGNVPSVFQLKIESPDPRLLFKFFYQDVPLIEIPQISTPEPAPVGYTAPSGSRINTGESGESPPPTGSKLDTAQTAAKGREIAGKVGMVASLMGTLGNLIPGSLGNQLRSKGASVRGVQTSTLKTVQEPLRTQQKVTALKKDTSRLTGAGTRQGTTFNGSPNTEGPIRTPLTTQSGLVPETARPGGAVNEYRAQTKDVNPGESVSFTLQIDSKGKRIPEGSYLYIIHSQQVSLEPASVQIPPVTSRGTVHFKPVSTWRYWLPIIVCGTVVVLTFLSLSYYLTNF